MTSAAYQRFKEVDDALAVYGHGCGTLSPLAMKMVDEHGLRPGDQDKMRTVLDSAFALASGTGSMGEPVFSTKDFQVDEDAREPVSFGYLEGKETYGEFDLVPWMGIADKMGQSGMCTDLDDYNVFGDNCDEVTDIQKAMGDTNKTYTYEPVSMVSSREFKDVNDAIRNYEKKFQPYCQSVLVLGCGSNTLAGTFDFSASHVVYLDESVANINEIKRRFQEIGCRPKSFDLVCGSFESAYGQLKKRTYSLIVANNSVHYICQGSIKKQRQVLTKILDLLADGGALVGAGPSLSGLIATPYTQESRNKHGLYGLMNTSDGGETVSHLGGVQYKEPIFYSTLLYEFESTYKGKAEVCHLSTFSQGMMDSNLIRCYESFAFVLGRGRPHEVEVAVEEDSRNISPLMQLGVRIFGRKAQAITLGSFLYEGSVTNDRTYGALLRSQHTPALLYQGPYCVSGKIDGVLGELTFNNDKWTLTFKNKIFAVDLPLPYVKEKHGAYCFYQFIVEVLVEDPRTVKCYWLETVACHGRPPSWLSGLRREIPLCLGVKDYFPLSSKNFISELVKGTDAGFPRDGVVIHNPHERGGGWKPRQMFFKRNLSVDVEINGKVYEMFRDKAVERSDHEQNGAMRLFEAPFLINERVALALLAERFKLLSYSLGEHDFHSLDEVFSYPAVCGSRLKARSRNTALVQLWRGNWQMEDDRIVSLLAPLARHPDWGLFGVLADTMIGDGVHDKDGIFRPPTTHSVSTDDFPEEELESIEKLLLESESLC